MQLPKGKLLALVIAFVAIGLVTATGAFTTVAAERTATVDVAGDQSANLGISPHSTSPNGDYAEITNDGTFQLDLSNVNLEAETTFDLVFNLTNNGQEDVGVFITKSGDNADLVEFYNGTDYDDSAQRIDNSSSNAQFLGTGETITVSIRVDTTDTSLSAGDELLSSITITADAGEADTANGNPN